MAKSVPAPTQERLEVHSPARPPFAPSNAAAAAALAGGPRPAPPAGQDMVGNGAIAAARRAEPAPQRSPAAEPPAVDTPEAKTPDAKARPGPDADPKFATLKKDVRRKKRSVASSHPPPRAEAGAAQDAARPPKDDEEAQGKTANAEKMNEAKPKEFDKDAFIRAVEKAIAEKAPKNLDEADKFADSGKADEVRAEVHGKVGEGKTDSAAQIATTTAAPPDTSAAVPKKVVPMTPDRPPGTPGTPNPANAVPDKLPPSATDLSAGPARVDRQMADAQVTETQLKKSNEPTFKNALGEKKAAERHSEVAPGRMRGHEKKELRAATAQAQRLGAVAMGAIGAQRVKTGQQVGAGKTGAKGRDEEKRAQVTTILQGVFDTMKKDVEAILDGLDKLVDDQFGREEKAARDAFTAEHKRKMEEYKDRRYSGWTGKARWLRDLFAGLPAEADKIFEEARDNYVRRMRQVISDVADTIGGELNRAKRRIAQGRAEMQDAVRKLPADLRSIGQQAAAEFTDKFDELTQSVDDKGTQLVDTLATKYTDALKSVDDEIAAEKEKNKGLVAKAVDAIKSVINTILELKRLLLSVLAKAASAVMLILKDPIGFLRNLVSAVGAGLRQFLANIGRHLQQGILSWLLGKTAEAGIELPSKFDAQGVLRMLASLLGLTWQNIRSRIVRKVPKMEPAVAAAETAVPLVAEVRKRGVAGMWDDLKTRVGDLKKDLLDKVIAYVTPTIVVAGITWIISLLNPASAFVRAVKLIIDIVRFIVTQARQIFEFVNAVLDAVIAIARGGSGGVPGLIERALARSIPVLLGVLAAILGVGGIAAKVKQIVQAMTKPVNRAVDWVIDKIVGLVKKLWAKIKVKFEKKPKTRRKPSRAKDQRRDGRRPSGKKSKGKNRRSNRRQPPTPQQKQPPTPQQKAKTLRAASAEARRRLVAGATTGQMHSILQQVHRKYAPRGLTSLRMERTGEHRFRVVAKGSPASGSADIYLQAKDKALEHVSGDKNALLLGERLEGIWQKAQESAKEISNETETKLQNHLNAEAEKPKSKPRDDTTWARGVLTFAANGQEGVETRRAASGARLKDHKDVHNARGAHAEEQVTLHFRQADLPKFPANPQLVSNVSVRYEVSRSPCINCANFIADFVTRDLKAKTLSKVNAVVSAAQLYAGSTVFTGEIMHRYRKIFETFAPPNKVRLLQEVQEALQQKIGQEKAENGKNKTKLLPEKKKRFAGYPGTVKGRAAEDQRRAIEWGKIPVNNDVRHEWFHISAGPVHGTLGLAILRAHGIEVTSLGGAALGLGHPDPTSESDRPLTPAEATAMTTEEKEARKNYLNDLNIKGEKLIQEVIAVDQRLEKGPADSSGKPNKDDKWVEDHGYVGG
ncbi:hypothetical protein [Streptomyces sparsogenes]|uniref:Uncharacterized protein n=1 Tax=Streptomyces sparsogenes DSM 40356 TaxID=1331668 RepID=A0A1R1SDN9_9ACTN|nr:hypothetical protein [Streptomyces sparsogenes]OMI36430.1 hypothetical protein SPAR_26141 [Streptomyces sparsogenes DSM 40356]